MTIKTFSDAITALAKELTPDSILLFLTICRKADFDYEYDPEEAGPHGYVLARELKLTAAQRGNLTDLKKKGFLTIEWEDDAWRRSRGMAGGWVYLTKKAGEIAEALDIL